MKDDNLFRSLTQMRHTQAVRSQIPAKLGDCDNHLYAYRPDGSRDPGMVWARVDGLGVCRVRCRKVTQKYGWPVLVEYGRDGVLEVVGENGEEAIRFAGERGGDVGPHRWSHDLLGSDPDFIQGLRLKPLLCRPTEPPSLSVYVEPYSYEYGGTRKTWPGGELDLTAEVPTSGSEQALIVVCLNPATNALSYYTGTAVSPFVPGTTGQPFTAAQIDAINTGADWQSAAIRAYTGQTQFLWPDWVADRREWIGTLETGVYVTKALFDANTILKADADNTPEALTVLEQRLVGRITGGEITGLTAAETKTLLAVDHGADLAGLADDDHTQYALLAGRTGGQTLNGGTGSGDGLTLDSTIHATKGLVSLAGGLLQLSETSGVVINEAGSAVLDVRIEGDTDANLLFVDVSADKVGIGTSSPINLLHLFRNNGTNATINATTYRDSAGEASLWLTDKARLSGGIPATVQNGDYLGTFQFRGYDGSSFRTAAKIISYVAGAPGASDMPGGLLFQVSPDGSITTEEKLRITPTEVAINDNGLSTTDFRVEGDADANLLFTDASADKVGIGDAAPGEKLDVAGNINVTGVLKIDDTQVVSNRVVDARIDDAISDVTWGATEAGVLDAIRDAMISHGLIAAA